MIGIAVFGRLFFWDRNPELKHGVLSKNWDKSISKFASVERLSKKPPIYPGLKSKNWDSRPGGQLIERPKN